MPTRTAGNTTIWFRLILRDGAVGPGKIALMRLIADTGSVSAAARALRMSHARSVKLVAEINALGAAPLIETRSGGESGGGASLTTTALELLAEYAALEEALAAAAAPHLVRMQERLGRT